MGRAIRLRTTLILTILQILLGFFCIGGNYFKSILGNSTEIYDLLL